MSDLIETT